MTLTEVRAMTRRELLRWVEAASDMVAAENASDEEGG
jgi:hypothetical protein